MHFPLPQRIHESDELGNVATVSFGARPPTLRERVNQPFEALAHRPSRRRRLNGWVHCGAELPPPELNQRASQLVTNQDDLDLGPTPISLLRFGPGPQLLVA